MNEHHGAIVTACGRTTSISASATVMIMAAWGVAVDCAKLPTKLPTSTASIDYNQQGYTGTIPTQVRLTFMVFPFATPYVDVRTDLQIPLTVYFNV